MKKVCLCVYECHPPWEMTNISLSNANCKKKICQTILSNMQKKSVYEDTNLAVCGFNLYFNDDDNDYDNDNDDEKCHLVFVRI